MKVFISGQGYFASDVLRLCIELGLDVVGVCCPADDKHIGRLAVINNIPLVTSGSLNADTLPEGVDLGVAAHSFDYIGKRTRYKTRYGWIGYHPSLLPRHRGRSSIEWAIRMNDAITGGTIFWLNSGIDRGDVAYQDWCFIDPALRQLHPREAAGRLWRSELQDIGLRLFRKALTDIRSGVFIKKPQDERFGTFEPNTDVKDVYKPDLLMIGP